MVILGIQNKIIDFFMILAWASPFNYTDYLDYYKACDINMLLCIVLQWGFQFQEQKQQPT